MKARGALAVGFMAAVIAMAAALPDLAQACSVCGGGQTDQVTNSFLRATLFMTGLPLSIITMAGLALRRRLKQIAAIEAADDPRRPSH